MEYRNYTEGIFLERLNRFVAKVLLGGVETFVHVPNTGRCREILIPGSRVILTRAANEKRKYPFSLIAAYKGGTLINIDSAAANTVAAEALAMKRIAGLETVEAVRREVTYAHSRFDFSFSEQGKTAFMEVKGVTLERDAVASFPDAPTERGSRHLRELIEAKEAGYGAYVLFILQMPSAKRFVPNGKNDPVFAARLVEAAKAGVGILAYTTLVTPLGMTIGRAVSVVLPD